MAMTYAGKDRLRERAHAGWPGLIVAAAYSVSAVVPAMAQVPPPPVPPQNPITQPKRVLGKLLFWEEQLSSDDTVSCGTCHKPSSAGGDARFALHPGFDETFGTPDDVFGSRGVVRQDASGEAIPDPLFGLEAQVTSRSAQAFFGGLWAPSAFWDGRAGSTFINPQTGAVSIPVGGALENQATGPILSDVEMAHVGRTWEDVVTKLEQVEPMALATYLPPDMAAAVGGGGGYPDLFEAAFGDPAITAERIAFAIATYERTLVANQTPFDLRTMTPQQQRGFGAFQNPNSRCSICHTPPLFTNNTFRNIGVRPIVEDPGRQAVTGNPADAGRFKVPTVRNAGLKQSFMHNGRKESLEQVLDFYLEINGEVQFPENQDPLIAGIAIPPPARLDIIEFLRNGLTDPRAAAETFPFNRPILHSEVGDADRDDDVDIDDHSILVDCFTGPGGGPVAVACRRLDADGDGDVDLADASTFQLRFGE